MRSWLLPHGSRKLVSPPTHGRTRESESSLVKTMSRFLPAFLAALAAALLIPNLSGQPAAAAGGKFNVLVLMTDEHNAAITGCYGDPVVRTPTLDALAASGVRFTAAYCQNPICVPSRVSLVSGRMPSNLHQFGNANTQKYEGVTTLADLFITAGYEAAWFGKTHWGNPRFPRTGESDQRQGFEKVERTFGRLPQDSAVSTWPVEQNTDHITANEALDFLEKNRDRKFFLGVSFVKPHFPFTIQPKYHEMYRGRVGLPPRATDRHIAELPAISRKERATYRHAEASEAEIVRARELYYGMVTYVDEEFGRIVRKLEELGLRDDTIIVYTADHGEMLGERGIWYKNAFQEGSVRIPFIWTFPKRLPQGRVVAAPAMNMDIFPTLAELCGLPAPAGLEGSSLVPVMTGRDDGNGRRALSENFRSGFAGRMIRTARWKYFFYRDGEEFLYDMENDPDEETNLAQDPRHRATAAEMRKEASAGWVLPPRGRSGQSGQVK